MTIDLAPSMKDDAIKEIVEQHLDGQPLDPKKLARVVSALRKAVGRKAPEGTHMVEFDGDPGGFWLMAPGFPERFYPGASHEEAMIQHFGETLRLFQPTEVAAKEAGIAVQKSHNGHERQLRGPDGKWRRTVFREATPKRKLASGFSFFR